MKKIYIFFALLILSYSAQAQLTGINPNIAVLNQTLSTTITSSGLFMQSSSPSGNIYEIKLVGPASYTIDIFNLDFVFNPTTTVTHPDTITTDITIPLAAQSGLYELRVTVGDVFDPHINQIQYTLPNAFTVTPPDGYIMGNVYDDTNLNGIKDIGEPGLAGQSINIMPDNITMSTNGTGDFNIPSYNGNHQVQFIPTPNNYLFQTSSPSVYNITINNNNSTGNDFGTKHALTFVSPDSCGAGMTTTFVATSGEPIFFPGVPAYGNVYYFRIYKPGGSSIVSYYNSGSITVIDSFHVQCDLPVPFSSIQGTGYKVYVYLFNNNNHELPSPTIKNTPPPLTITGNIYFDANLNGTKDTGEPGIYGGKVFLTPDSIYAYANNNGDYYLGANNGTHTVEWQTSYNTTNMMLSSAQTSYTFTANGSITGLDFGLKSSLPDYSIDEKNIYIWPRCFSNQSAQISAKNISNIPYKMEISCTYTGVTYVASSPPPTNIIGNTLYWDILNVQPFNYVYVYPMFTLPGGGQQFTLQTSASSMDGSNVIQFTDSITYTFTTICSLDPNDKSANPVGVYAQHYTLMSDTIEYLIRFQNTGNDTAFRVVIKDTIDSSFDLATFDVMESSHSMQTMLKNDGEVRFIFDNILLPDSNINEPESHGYVKYRIHAKPGLPNNTPVYNLANIYFDYNPPVETNNTFNTLVYTIPVGLDEITIQDGISVYPNPVDESATLYFKNPAQDKFTFTISDLEGRNVFEQNVNSEQIIIQKRNLNTGLYLFKLSNGAVNYYGKFVIR